MRRAHLGSRTVADAELPGRQCRWAQVEAARGKVQHAKKQCGQVGQREGARCWARSRLARPCMGSGAGERRKPSTRRSNVETAGAPRSSVRKASCKGAAR